MPYERHNIARMTGYTPGEQPDGVDVVKLNTNENPYPPSRVVMETLRTIDGDKLRRYPNPTARPFREAAAELHGVSPQQIIATNGGDELLRLVITTFVEPGRPVGTVEPSYSLYPVLAAIHDTPTLEVLLDDEWAPPAPEALAQTWNDAGAQLAFIVNPHAPSGRLMNTDELAAVAQAFNGVLVVDEAYIDFVDPAFAHDTVPLADRFDNVLLLRTMSKGYSLAGLRFGYGIASAGLVEPMQTKTKDSYNTDAISQALATAALEGQSKASRTWAAVRDERKRVTAELITLGLSVAPSQSNFVLATVPDSFGGGAGAVYESLKARNILVRYFDADRLRDKLRITIGTPEENTALLKTLRDLL